MKRIAGSCFERDVFILEQSRELLETVRARWSEELEFLWDDYPECAIRADGRFLPAYHMNKRTWFAIRLDGGVELAEILRLTERSRAQAAKK